MIFRFVKKSDWAQIVADLVGDDPKKIHKAARDLCKVAEAQHLPDLYRLMDLEDPFVNLIVAEPLVVLDGLKALEVLLKGLGRTLSAGNDGDGWVEAISSVMEENPCEAKKLLNNLLDSDDLMIREQAAWALNDLKG